eukprot:jgi/Psemu1/53714/gm1.53714_g
MKAHCTDHADCNHPSHISLRVHHPADTQCDHSAIIHHLLFAAPSNSNQTAISIPFTSTAYIDDHLLF